MDARSFKKKVADKATPDVSREALESSIDYFLSQGKRENCHVADCIQHAYGLMLEAVSEGVSTYQLPPDSFPAGQGELLMKQAESWIESLRLDLFGKTDPPFNKYQEAVKWMKHEASRQPEPTTEDRMKAKELEREVIARLEEISSLTHYPAEYRKPLPLILPYADFEAGQVQCLSVNIQPPLGTLASRSQEVAVKLGFRQVAVVAWILTGAPPSLPGARLVTTGRVVFTPGGEVITRRSRIDIYSPEVKAANLAKLCERARADLRSVRLSPAKKLLLDIMQDKGDLATGDKRDYWESIRVEYNRRKPRSAQRYKTWEGPRMAFLRLDSNYKKAFPRLTGGRDEG